MKVGNGLGNLKRQGGFDSNDTGTGTDTQIQAYQINMRPR